MRTVSNAKLKGFQEELVKYRFDSRLPCSFLFWATAAIKAATGRCAGCITTPLFLVSFISKKDSLYPEKRSWEVFENFYGPWEGKPKVVDASFPDYNTEISSFIIVLSLGNKTSSLKRKFPTRCRTITRQSCAVRSVCRTNLHKLGYTRWSRPLTFPNDLVFRSKLLVIKIFDGSRLDSLMRLIMRNRIGRAPSGFRARNSWIKTVTEFTNFPKHLSFLISPVSLRFVIFLSNLLLLSR